MAYWRRCATLYILLSTDDDTIPCNQILKIARDEFPDNPDLQNARLLHKWASSANVLIEGLRKPDLILLLVDIANQAEKNSIHFKHIITSCEVKYTHSNHLSNVAKAQAAELGFFCMWKQVDRCYYVAFSLCGSILTIFHYTRGGARLSESIDIDVHRSLFVRLLITMCLGGSKSHLWLGYDNGVVNVKIGDTPRKQVTLCSPTEAVLTFIRSLFMAHSLKGRGTRIWLAQDQQHRYCVLKDCWLPKGWENDASIHHLLQDQSRDDPQFAVEVRSPEDESIFGDQDVYHIFDDPVFDEPNYHNSLKGIPTLLYWDEVQRPDGTGELVPEMTWMLLGLPPSVLEYMDYENRQHSRAAFLECGIGITWFCCAREFFNAMMGAFSSEFVCYNDELISISIDRTFQRLCSQEGPSV